MTDITTIGEILVDLTRPDRDTAEMGPVAAFPGGAPANVAVAAARLGATTAFLGKVGRDDFGWQLRCALANNGVDTSGLLTDSAPTSMAVVSVRDNGEQSYSFLRGADVNLHPEEVDEYRLEHSKFLHFGSVSLTAGPSRSATIFAARHAHLHGALVSFDPNYRPPLWRTRSDAQQWLTIPLPLVDVIKVAEEDLFFTTGTDDPEEASRRLEEKGVSLVLVTLHARGALFRWQGQTGLVPGTPVDAVDTNGAGAAFLGAVLSRLAARGDHPLEGLTVAELTDILTFANRVAAWTCGHSGAIPAMPTLAQLESDDGGTRV